MCETINLEVDRLILSAWPRTREENQVRKIQFMALIERRNEAARHFSRRRGRPARVQIARGFGASGEGSESAKRH